MLDIHDLDVSIGPTHILRKVHISVSQGAMVGLVGRNGAGKTTLMRTIMGLLSPASGHMTFYGQDLVALPAHHRTSLGIGYAPEDRRLVPDLSVLENLCAPAWALGARDIDVRIERVYGVIPELREFAPRRAMQLSGGQQKLVAIGRALMTAEKLLLLDEPFEGVAPALAQRIAQVVGELRKQGLGALLSGADLQHAGGILDEVCRMDRGEMVS